MHAHVHTRTHTDTHMAARTHAGTHTHIHTHTHTHAHTRTHARMHARTHTHTHTHFDPALRVGADLHAVCKDVRLFRARHMPEVGSMRGRKAKVRMRTRGRYNYTGDERDSHAGTQPMSHEKYAARKRHAPLRTTHVFRPPGNESCARRRITTYYYPIQILILVIEYHKD
jgi:hypothetical protein